VQGFGRNILFWLAVVMTLAFLFNIFQNNQGSQATKTEVIAYSDFMTAAKAGSVSDITIKGQDVIGHYASSGGGFRTMVPMGENIVERLEGSGVRIKAEPDESGQVSFFSVCFLGSRCCF
jgi:cell division protease FtsH